MHAISTSFTALGICAASSSLISRFNGFSTTSFLVAVIPAPSFNLISPSASSKSNALASLVVSLGTATEAPSLRFLRSSVFPA